MTAQINKAKTEAVFLLADIKTEKFHQLPNGYCGDGCEFCRERPWWLVETEFGLIKIGWRKRVISIEWESTKLKIHGKEVLAKGEEWVTNWETGVHAYGWIKATEYLARFSEIARRHKFIQNKDKVHLAQPFEKDAAQ